MIEPAGYLLSAGRTGAAAPGRRVIGKTLVAVSALGMMAVLVALAEARYLLAGSAFLLTVGVLELMFQRALAVFHGSVGPLPAPARAIGHPARRPAAAGDGPARGW